MKKKRLKALLVGACHVDIFADTEFEFTSLAGRDLPGSFVVSLGGTVFNVCAGLKSLGVDCFLVSAAREDSIFTRLIHSELARAEIKHNIIMLKNSKESAFLAVRQRGELVLAVTSSAWDVTGWNKVGSNLITFLKEGYDFAVFDCNLSEDVLKKVIDLAPCRCYICCVSPAKTVRFLNILRNNSSEHFSLDLKKVRAIFMNEEEFEVAMYYKVDPFSTDFMWFVTRGKNGVVVFISGKKLDFRVKEITNAKSFSGSGDAFAAGVIYGLESGLDLQKAVNLGYEMVLRKVKNKGACVIHVDLAEITKSLDVDLLTGCLNRNALERDKNRLEGFTHVLLIDIDHFKRINDTYGHDYGDKVLREVATVVRSCIRKNDRLYRYGGEEFVLFLFNTTDEEAIRVAERINSTVKEKTPVTVTVGVSKVIGTIENSMKKADIALYEGKSTGRNRVVFSFT